MNGYDRFSVGSDGPKLAAYVQPGQGPIVVMQHGLCGDANQPAEIFPRGQGFRHAVMDCRGHGQSVVGPEDQLSIAVFTQDVAAMIETLDRPPIAVGGISMGAAIALRLAVLRPDLVRALILVRPAWGIESAPANMRPNAMVGEMLADGRDVTAFDQSATARALAIQAPDNLASLHGFFDRTPRDVTAALLCRISADGPGLTAADLAALTIPVLILCTPDDVIHPIALSRQLATLIPGAMLHEMPSKGQNRAAHTTAVQDAITDFLKGLT